MKTAIEWTQSLETQSPHGQVSERQAMRQQPCIDYIRLVPNTGAKCPIEDLSRVLQVSRIPKLPTLAIVDRFTERWPDVNSSDADKFLRLVCQETEGTAGRAAGAGGGTASATDDTVPWADINFIATHGYFMRRVMRACGSEGEAIDASLHYAPNLLMLQIKACGRYYVLVRHCTRQYQGNFWMERVTVDPGCARDGDDNICDEEHLASSVRKCVEEIEKERVSEVRGDHGTREVRVFSSCSRRAVETANVILASLDTPDEATTPRAGREVGVGGGRIIRVLPFCREETNILGSVGLDVMNTCSEQNFISMLSSSTARPTI